MLIWIILFPLRFSIQMCTETQMYLLCISAYSLLINTYSNDDRGLVLPDMLVWGRAVYFVS